MSIQMSLTQQVLAPLMVQAGDRQMANDVECILRPDVDLLQQDLICDGLLDYDEDESDSDSDSDEVLEVPTTNTGLPLLDVTMMDDSYIPLHAVLNNCGSLLIRRHCKLIGTKRQHHFMHKIASTNPELRPFQRS